MAEASIMARLRTPPVLAAPTHRTRATEPEAAEDSDYWLRLAGLESDEAERLIARHEAKARGGGAATILYVWSWRARLPERHGQLFRVLARGTLNSCLVEFVEDGARYVTSRNALRKA